MVATADHAGKQRYDQQCARKTQLFTDHSENIVIILKRQIQIFLPGFAKTQSEQATGANGVQRLQDLIAGITGILVLSGETTQEILDASEDKPHLVLEHAGEILSAIR